MIGLLSKKGNDMAERIPFPKIELSAREIAEAALYKVVDVGLAAGRLVTRHIMWEPQPHTSDHYVVHEAVGAVAPIDPDEYRRFDLAADVAHQTHQPLAYDSEGSWHHLEENAS